MSRFDNGRAFPYGWLAVGALFVAALWVIQREDVSTPAFEAAGLAAPFQRPASLAGNEAAKPPIESPAEPVRTVGEVDTGDRSGDGGAVFSGWVVDSLGNVCGDCEVKAYPLHEVAQRDLSSQRSTRSAADGAFEIQVPCSWRDAVVGVVVESGDHLVAELLQAQVREGVTLVVASPGDARNRLRGGITVRGAVDAGHWLMPLDDRRSLIAGGTFCSGRVDLAGVPLNVRRDVWRNSSFGIAILEPGRAPLAYRSFRGELEWLDWLASRPVIDVIECAVHVPEIDGEAVVQLEFGLSEVAQFGVVWWGRSDVVDGLAMLRGERGVSWTILGKAGGRSGRRAIGQLTLSDAPSQQIEWLATLRGELDCAVPVRLANGASMPSRSVRDLKLRAVPVIAGRRVLTRGGWRTARIASVDRHEHRVGEKAKGGAVSADGEARFQGMAAGVYDFEIVQRRTVIASMRAELPGPVPVMSLPPNNAVVFCVDTHANGRRPDAIELRYARAGEAPRSAVLALGLGGFRGIALQRVEPGLYRYCLRTGERRACGDFAVLDDGGCVRVDVRTEATVAFEGRMAAHDTSTGDRVRVIDASLAADWLSCPVGAGGDFCLRLPASLGRPELELVRADGEVVPMRERPDGRWVSSR